MKYIVRADVPDDKNARKELVISALESGIVSAIVRPEDADFSSLGKIGLFFNDNGTVFGSIGSVSKNSSGKGIFCCLKSPADQDVFMESGISDKFSFIILEKSDWTIIPLENLIAHFRKTNTEIFAVASSVPDAVVFSQTLECGVDGIVIESPENDPAALPSLISEMRHAFSGCGNESFSELCITSVRPVGMGDRVCIDTCSMMKPGEGMLIGSQSSCLFLIQSESEDNGYVASRPFRVNAGAVHSYILVPDGKTRYLSEMKAGDSVLIVGRSGAADTGIVGRCKIERRPLVLVEAELKSGSGNKKFSVILQNAETVKMIGPKGAISVSELKDGCIVFAKTETGGRHFGMAVDETIHEI